MTTNEETINEFRAVLRRFERLSQRHLHTCCRQVSVAQCHVLLAISAAGQSTATDLARLLELDISTVSRTVHGLVTRDLLVRRDQPEDRRQTPLALTDKGQRVCAEINRDANRFCAEVLARVPAARRSAILKGFAMLVDAFAQSQECASACCNDSQCEVADCES